MFPWPRPGSSGRRRGRRRRVYICASPVNEDSTNPVCPIASAYRLTDRPGVPGDHQAPHLAAEFCTRVRRSHRPLRACPESPDEWPKPLRYKELRQPDTRAAQFLAWKQLAVMPLALSGQPLRSCPGTRRRGMFVAPGPDHVGLQLRPGPAVFRVPDVAEVAVGLRPAAEDPHPVAVDDRREPEPRLPRRGPVTCLQLRRPPSTRRHWWGRPAGCGPRRP